MKITDIKWADGNEYKMILPNDSQYKVVVHNNELNFKGEKCQITEAIHLQTILVSEFVPILESTDVYYTIERGNLTGEFFIKEVYARFVNDKHVAIRLNFSNNRYFEKSKLDSDKGQLFTSKENAIKWFDNWKNESIKNTKSTLEQYERMTLV